VSSCPHCAAPIADGARFCPTCGKALVPTSEAPTPAPVVDPFIDRDIAGRYRVVAKLGEGGMGAVYRGEQISLKRAIAIKVLRAELSQNTQLVARFHAEAAAVAKLSHPNTVNIIDFGSDNGTLFIAMEFVDGASLREVVAREAPLAPARALFVAQQIAASIADAHAHAIVHRDLKPDNVMLQTRGRHRDLVRVLDFGIAKLRDGSRATQQQMTMAGDVLGTPQYMAPEQIRGEPVDGRVDIYALGCILYEMVTARMPFEAPAITAMLGKHLVEPVVPPSVRRPDLALPPAIDQLVLAAMAKHADARPPTMDAFGEQIGAALGMLPQPTPHAMPVQTYAATGTAPVVTPPAPSFVPAPPPAAVVAPRPRGHGRAMTIGVAALAIAVVVVAVAATRGGSSAEKSGSAGSSEPARTPEPPANSDDTDRWANAGTTTDDQIVDVAQGVKLRLPTNYSATRNADGNIVASNGATTIFAGPITSSADDVRTLAADYARTTGFQIETKTTVPAAGAQRPAGVFRGQIGNVAVRHIVVAYIGPGYRVAVVLHVPLPLWSPEIERFGAELFDKRVLLP
jgi:serine/threonine-protein kinase